MIIPSESAAYNAAFEIMELGWAPIPIVPGKKVPTEPYKTWTEPPPEATVRAWFSSGDFGLGAVLGRPSGGLCHRDWDRMDAFQEWATKYPRLADSLPRTNTGRGKQLFFYADEADIRSASPSDSLYISGDDGELKGQGIAVLPPSLHHSGITYTWDVSPFQDVPYIPDLYASGLVPHTGGLHKQSLNKGKDCDGDFYSSGDLAERVLEAIRVTIPLEIGQRHRMIFDFVRRLRAMPELRSLTQDEQRQLAWHWFQRAYYSIGTKKFAETWKNFRNAWRNVQHPAGECIKSLFEEARGDGIDRLTDLCRILQELAGDDPFHLDCRTAGNLFGKSHVTANKWLNVLLARGELTLAKEHEYQKGKKGQAREFYYGPPRKPILPTPPKALPRGPVSLKDALARLLYPHLVDQAIAKQNGSNNAKVYG